MSEFTFIACDKSGVSIKGRLSAETIEAVGAELDRRGLIPVQMKLVRDLSDRWRIGSGAARWGIKEKILFTRKFASLLRAGIPLLSVLGMISEQTREPAVAAAIRRIGDMVGSGATLSDAMAEYPRLFDPVFLGALRTGEATGRLDSVLEQTADYLEREMNTKQLMKKTVRYPMMVLIALVVAGAFIVAFVVPKFLSFYSHFGAQLPMPTRVLLGVSGFMQAYWWMFPVLGIAGWFSWRNWMKKESGRLRRDGWILRMPLVGELFLKVLVIRFTRLFGILYGAGVPASAALETAAGGVGNLVVSREVIAMRDRLSEGAPVSAAPINAVMPNLVYQMLGIGFESGDVERMMSEVARHYGQEVEYDVRRLADKLEPLILVFLAGGVLLLALAVLLPMWNLISIFHQ
ncbi:MAG: type II secretion system F family protein [candidate division Zixibacteria bacterium]|nr:type II secretion system F family protein [candidate division Zixibacteria bacterium]